MSKKLLKTFRETYYGSLLKLKLDDDRFYYLEAALLRALGPEKALVLTLVLEIEFHCAQHDPSEDYDDYSDDAEFYICLEAIADRSNLSIRRVIRRLKELSDLPPYGWLKRAPNIIHVVHRQSDVWCISVDPDFRVQSQNHL
jgi:hypothetical protein